MFNREVVSNGYITQIGLFHDNMFNQFNLACDLMEPYRPLIDRQVVEMNPKQFEKDEKHEMVSVLNKEIFIDGRKELLDVLKLLKMYDVRIEPQCNTVFERLMEYTKVLSRLLGKKLLVLTNITSFLRSEDIEEFVNMCAYLKIYLLFIESKEIPLQVPVKTYIIDNDKCLIIK